MANVHALMEVLTLYRVIRPLLFRLSPEAAHHLVLHTLSVFPGITALTAPRFSPPAILQQQLWNLSFPHPVGLAAGLDKDGVAVTGFLRCGFSFVEVGTVTPKAQPGNPSPRLFRLVEDEALINRMGFNNQGGAHLLQRLRRRRQPGIVGINIGKNKDTPNDSAVFDYVELVRTLYLMADYIVINVSSPNTPGLRDLQAQETLIPLVKAVVEERDRQFARLHDRIRPHWAPVLVKLAPDLADDDLAELAARLVDAGADGFIATNTTLTRPDLTSPLRTESGGLSGRPLFERSTQVLSLLYRAVDGKVPIIGSGGVFTPDDAYRKILAGASLIQVYTGFIYRGPAIIKEIIDGLAVRLRADGFASLSDAVGRGA